MSERIPLSTPTLNGTEADYVNEAFETNWVSSVGANINALEREVSQIVGVGHAAALSSGTAAIHLAYKAVGVGQGDVVFCQDLTFAATCNPIIYQNAIPVFIDSEPQSWNMCPKALEMAFAKYPSPKAVMCVNLYGVPANLEAIADICRAHNVPLIEDAAESLGSTLNGRQTCTFGKIGILSFNGNKIITTSGGGMLLSDDEAIVQKAIFWSNQSKDPAPYYHHTELGYNYRMSNICAGIGRGQLKTLSLRIQQKTDIYNNYAKAFAHNDIISMNPVPASCVPNHWLSCIILDKRCSVTSASIPASIIETLERENIEARRIWKPMSLQPYYKNCDFIKSAKESVSADIFERGLCLPSDVKMTRSQQERVCNLILEAI